MALNPNEPGDGGGSAGGVIIQPSPKRKSKFGYLIGAIILIAFVAITASQCGGTA